MNAHPKIETVEIHDPRPPAFSDDALALRFAERHANQCAMSPPGADGSWREMHWQFDETVAAFDLARASVARPRPSAIKPKIASAIASAKTVVAVERLARSDRRHAATVDQWDADPWLLNTPGGVIDLRIGCKPACTARRLPDQNHRRRARRRVPALACSSWTKSPPAMRSFSRLSAARARLRA